MPELQRSMLRVAHTGDDELTDRHVLIVDDDIRNIFALTAALEQRGMTVSTSRNGREALDKLHQTNNIDIVLMDIHLRDELDGVEAAKHILHCQELDL